MKKQTLLLRIFATSIFLSLFLFNIGSLRCESNADTLINIQSKARYAEQKANETIDPDLQDYKSQRFKELEWIIIQNLVKRYQKLEEEEDQEDILN